MFRPSATGHHPAFYRSNGKTQTRLQTFFSLLLTLSYKGSVEYLGDKLREEWLTAEDLNMLNDKTLIANEPGHKQSKVK